MDHIKGKELSFAMGGFNSSGRMGTVLTFLLSPIIGTYFASLMLGSVELLTIGLVFVIGPLADKNVYKLLCRCWWFCYSWICSAVNYTQSLF